MKTIRLIPRTLVLTPKGGGKTLRLTPKKSFKLSPRDSIRVRGKMVQSALV